MEDTKRTLTRKETATSLGIGLVALDMLLRRRDDPLPSVRVGRRVIVPIKEFELWLSRQVGKEAC